MFDFLDLPIADKILKGERVSCEEGAGLYNLPPLALAWLADNRREIINPNRYVTFVVDRVISYTNVCKVACRFCAFYRPHNHSEAYMLSDDEILKKIEELVTIGGTQVLFQGGINPFLDLNYYINIFKKIKSNFSVHIHSLSPVEVDYIAQKAGLTLCDTIKILKEAGLDSIPGAGAEILVERVRKIIAPLKITGERWLEVMESAHLLGMNTSATMMYGTVETVEERIQHLISLRNLQDRTNGFLAFIPWSFASHHTKMEHIAPASGLDYLKTIAISRIVLDNFPHIQSGWLTEGHKMAQVALKFGADDMGGILMEDQVLGAAGIVVDASIKQMLQNISEAGKIPVQRNTKYEIIRIFD